MVAIYILVATIPRYRVEQKPDPYPLSMPDPYKISSIGLLFSYPWRIDTVSQSYTLTYHTSDDM